MVRTSIGSKRKSKTPSKEGSTSAKKQKTRTATPRSGGGAAKSATTRSAYQRQSTLVAGLREEDFVGQMSTAMELRPHHRTDEHYTKQGKSSSKKKKKKTSTLKAKKASTPRTKANMSVPSVNELRVALKAVGLSPRGRKVELVARLRKHRSSSSSSSNNNSSSSSSNTAAKTNDEQQVPLMCRVPLAAWFTASYNDYTPAERATKRWMHVTDLIAIPIWIAIYVALALTVFHPPDGRASCPAASAVPDWVFYSTCAAALVAIIVMYQHCYVAPFPLEENSNYAALQSMGKWIFLTRHGLCFQAVHLSFLAAQHAGLLPDELRCGIAASSIWHSGIEIFIMVQFFALIVPNESYREDIVKWNSMGVAVFEPLVIFAHVPCGILALLDVAVLQNRATLNAVTPPALHLGLAYVAYLALLLVLWHTNFHRSGCWPYGIFEALGTSPMKWTIFTIGQCVVLALFCGVAVGIKTYAPVAW